MNREPEDRTAAPRAAPQDVAIAVQAAVERFIAAHSCGEAPDLEEFARGCPEEARARVIAQCREFLAFDGLLGHQEWEPGEAGGGEGRAFGEFEIEEELGRGGMGIVYLARQRSLDRRVALKVMASGLTLSKRHVERFRREAAAAAQLAHPAIVPVHSLVEVDGAFAIAMDYIAGRNLGDILDDLRLASGPGSGPIEGTLGIEPGKGYVAECAIFCAQIAAALEAAHRQGVVHRDIKPRNLMIDDRRQARLLDFGLSKSLRDGSISLSGEITGTVHYMSPEQTLAKRVAVDHRTDVFALGVILYEMLTLRRPFDGKNMQQVVGEICFKEPIPPQRLNPKIPRDLVTICLKALEKDPQNRYQSAGECEADLQRFLRWEPIHARPSGALVRLSKWLHRHRTEAAAAAAVVVVAASWLGYSGFSAARENREADRLVAHAKELAGDGRYEEAFDVATRALGRRDDEEIRALIEAYRANVVAAARQAEVDVAESTRLSLASNQAIAQDRELAILLALEAVRRHDSWESRSAVLRALGGGFRRLSLDGHGGTVLCARCSPDGSVIVTTGTEQDGSSTAILYSADGERLHTLRGHAGWIVDAAFHPAGDRVATAGADRSVKLWQVETGELTDIWQHECTLQSVRFDAAGDRALTIGHTSGKAPFVARIWDVAAGRCVTTFSAHTHFIVAAAFSACGRFAATASGRGAVRLWSAESGEELARLDVPAGRVTDIAFSPDGSLLATAAQDGRVRIHAVPGGALLAEVGHSRQVNALAFDRSGGRLLTGSNDMTARLWRLARTDGELEAREEHHFVGHTAGLTAVGFDRDGQHVVTSGEDGVLRVFDAGSGSWSAGVELVRYEAGSRGVRGATFDASGQRVLAWNADRALVWDFRDTRGVVTLRQPGKVPAVCFDQGGDRVATAGDDENLRLWDAHAGLPLWTAGLGNPIDAIAIDAAGELIAASTAGGEVHVRRLLDGAELFTLRAHRSDVTQLRFRADGDRILSAADDGLAVVWNVKDRSEVMRLERAGPIVAADLSPDGSLLATVERGAAVVRLWSVPDKEPRGELAGAAGALRHVAFRPDGQALAAAGRDGNVLVFALAGNELQRVGTGSPVVHFAWSRDGERLLTSSPDEGSARIWCLARSTEPELRFDGHTDTVQCSAFSPDGKWAATASRDGTTCIWPTDPLTTARRLPLRAMTATERRQHHVGAGPQSRPR